MTSATRIYRRIYLHPPETSSVGLILNALVANGDKPMKPRVQRVKRAEP